MQVSLIVLQQVGGQAVLGRQSAYATPWLTERHGYDPTSRFAFSRVSINPLSTSKTSTRSFLIFII